MDGEAAIGLRESEGRTMNAEIKAHRAETGKSRAGVIGECRKGSADAAERRAAGGARQLAEFRREARADRRAMVAAVIVAGLGLAGLTVSIGLLLLERVNSLPGLAG